MRKQGIYVTVSLMLCSMVFACSGGSSGANDSEIIDITAIAGITAPFTGETPVTSITETDQYTGTVAWSPSDDPFIAETVYTATIALTAKMGYTLTGVTADFFTMAESDSVSNDADSGVITVVFPETEDRPLEVIDITEISGITAPVCGETPATTISETDQYTGIVSWSPSDNPFDYSTEYTATITLTAKSGYTLTGVSEDFFNVAGSDSVSNDADSSVITAVFPETTPPAEIYISAISGVTPPVYGETPVTTITETDQYTGTISWSPDHGSFDKTTVYTATITLTAKPGYTLTGISEDFFTVTGTTTVTNNDDSGVITAIFPETTTAAESGLSDVTTVGDSGTVTVSSETAIMIYSNDQSTGITFPTETDDSDSATITTQFFISETEVTWALMAEVLKWAVDNGKIVETSGEHNEVSSSTVLYGNQELLDLDAGSKISYNESTNSFSVASGYENYPVVYVSWYGSVMFCNWLTEMRDGNTDNVVYSGITLSWADTDTIANNSQSGYRLPTGDEWEYAARYLGKTLPSTGDDLDSECVYETTNYSGTDTLTMGYYWTPGDYASGANDDYDGIAGSILTADVSWYYDNTSLVNNVAGKTTNALGLYDMSGNVWEWCFTSSGSGRITRGGGWANTANHLQVGYWVSGPPNSEYNFIGFRFARTQ